ncbi:MAG: phosphatase PAP2 family protein [bacterium]
MATQREISPTEGQGHTLHSLAMHMAKQGFSLRTLLAGFKEWLLYRLATLGFDLFILMAMALLLVVTVLALGGHIRLLQASVALPASATLAALVARAWQKPGEWKMEVGHILRDWVPFLFIVFIYENLHDVAGQAMDFDIAGTLYRWDVALLGIEPTLWAQRIFSPLLTDVLSISYALYFFQPLFIMFLLSLWDMRSELRHMALALTIAFVLGFMGYVFLPASPPRYFIESLFTDPPRLYGLFLFDKLQGTWDSLSVISGGAFPSLHVGLSTVALIYAFRLRKVNRAFRIVWYVYLPLVVSLWFSTVYLRHHWVIDIFAGWIVAAAGLGGAELLMRAWKRLRERYALPFSRGPLKSAQMLGARKLATGAYTEVREDREFPGNNADG